MMVGVITTPGHTSFHIYNCVSESGGEFSCGWRVYSRPVVFRFWSLCGWWWVEMSASLSPQWPLSSPSCSTVERLCWTLLWVWYYFLVVLFIWHTHTYTHKRTLIPQCFPYKCDYWLNNSASAPAKHELLLIFGLIPCAGDFSDHSLLLAELEWWILQTGQMGDQPDSPVPAWTFLQYRGPVCRRSHQVTTGTESLYACWQKLQNLKLC